MSRKWVLVLVALAVGAAGCKSPAYVGAYSPVVTDEMKKAMESLPAQMRDEARARMEAGKAMTLTINADGTWTARQGMSGQSSKGTYTVEGNKLTMRGSGSSSHALTYNAADQTLSSDNNGQGEPMILKKK